MPRILEANESSKEYRKNWVRLIQKIYKIDPLTCPKCFGKMKVISVIEEKDVIKKILKRLGLWELKARPPPRANALQKYELSIDYSNSQFPVSDNLSRASRSNKWLYAEGLDFSGIGPEHLSEP